MKKLISLILALVMVMGLAVTAFADNEGEGGATPPASSTTGSITITPPDDVDADATNTYKIYKVFDAAGNGTNISYKLVSGKTTAPAGFSVDTAGNVTYAGTGTELTEADINAIAGYVTDSDLVATATSTGAANAVASGLPNGYYYITTTTGSVVTIDSTNPDATVDDKNSVPILAKVITKANSVTDEGTKALAEVGSNVTYKATITVGKGAKGYVFHDTMDQNQSYNGDAVVSNVDTGNYTIASNGNILTVTFEDGIAEGTKITITYSAKITSATLSKDPAINTAYVSYGANSQYETTEVTTSVYNAKFTVTKQDGDGAALRGAGFVIKNAANKYYKYNTTDGMVEWVVSIDNADEHTSDANGAVAAFTGLANGTYTLVEKTVPAGYNKAVDSTFTVVEGNYTASNLEQTATVTNNVGSELPSTGGIGTTLFYVIGGLLMAGAAVLLITKKRMA